jgi:hypothetical protein
LSRSLYIECDAAHHHAPQNPGVISAGFVHSFVQPDIRLVQRGIEDGVSGVRLVVAGASSKPDTHACVGGLFRFHRAASYMHPDAYTNGWEDDEILDAEGLGRLLGLGNPSKPGSPRRAIQAMIDRKQPLPPRINGIRGKRRKYLWRRSVAIRWVILHEEPMYRSQGGRPRKIDLLAMGVPDRERIKEELYAAPDIASVQLPKSLHSTRS